MIDFNEAFFNALKGVLNTFYICNYLIIFSQ